MTATANAVAARPAAATQPYLRLGTSGPAVAAWQKQLHQFRTSFRKPAVARIASDGVYGPNTAAATRDFQRYNKISVDGVVGPQTRTTIGVELNGSAAGSGSAGSGSSGSGTASAGLSSKVLRTGDQGARVTAWQERLDLFRQRVRKPTRPAIAKDGLYGPVTAAATRDLQQYAGISVDGVFGPNTKAAYERLAG